MPKELVVGDIIKIQCGMAVPADSVVFEANQFGVDESAITGDPTEVDKNTEYNCMVYKGSLCQMGEGKVIIISTGPRD